MWVRECGHCRPERPEWIYMYSLSLSLYIFIYILYRCVCEENIVSWSDFLTVKFSWIQSRNIYNKLSLGLSNSEAPLWAPSTWTVRHSRSDLVINIMLHANTIPSDMSPFSGERLAWQQIKNMASVFHSCNSFDLTHWKQQTYTNTTLLLYKCACCWSNRAIYYLLTLSSN